MRAALVAIPLLVACSGETITGTKCSDNSDCNLFNVAGRCESTGLCSYPDATCAEGQRYAPAAGNSLGGTCLGGDVPCGEQGDTCCPGGVCSANLTCATDTETCQCGASDQPCCGGTSCAQGLACGPSAVCEASSMLDVAVGKTHICALRMDHTVWCWGSDWKPYASSTPGLATPVISSETPVQIAGLANVDAISASEFSTCARETDKTLWCWGHGESGQLGGGAFASSLAAVQVQGLTNVSLFDGGRHHLCAVGTVGATPGVYCWGRGGRLGHGSTVADPKIGYLGNGGNVDQDVPVAVDLSTAAASGQTVKALSTGTYHSCIVMSDDAVWCWGRNDNGQALGTGTASGSTTLPVQVNLTGLTIPSGVTIDEVSCGGGNGSAIQPSTCLRLSNGTVSCWGHGANGELGDNTLVDKMAPTTSVVSAQHFTALGSAMNAHCALDDEGVAWCWGRNKAGVLGTGDGTEGNFKFPERVKKLTGLTRLEMAHHTACAIDGEHQLWCWGNNHRGQVGLRLPQDITDGSVLEPHLIAF